MRDISFLIFFLFVFASKCLKIISSLQRFLKDFMTDSDFQKKVTCIDSDFYIEPHLHSWSMGYHLYNNIY